MPFLWLLIVLVDVALAVHAVKTGRIQPWLWIILLVPLAGGAVYFVVHVWPELTRPKRRAEAPTLASLERALAKLDTPQTREELARAYLAAGRTGEAARTSVEGLRKRRDQRLLLVAAEALVEDGAPEAALEHLETLAESHPSYRPSRRGVLVGRAFEAQGRLDDACAEYARAARRHPGEEAHYRHAACLKKLGRKDDARAIFESIVQRVEEGTAAYHESEERWVRLAKRG